MIRHRFAPDTEVLDAVLGNRYELGLITMPPDDSRLQASRFLEEPLELVVPAGAQAQSWAQLRDLGFIDHPDGLAMASRLLPRQFAGCPSLRTLPISGFSNQIGLILEPVAMGLGFTVLPHYARIAFRQPEAIEVVELRNPIRDTLHLIHRSEWALSARARLLLDFLHEQLNPGGEDAGSAGSSSP